MSNPQLNNKKLDRSLSLFQATALVIGSTIGSGIFVSSAGMARGLESGTQLIAVWIFAGLMTILGGLTQAELCGRMPVTGGLYAYFKEVFGDVVAYIYGWANFMIAGSGAIAAIAFIFSSYFSEFIPLWQAPEYWQKWSIVIPHLGTLYPAVDLGQKILGSVLILLLTYLNVRGIRLGAWVQSLSASTKVLAIFTVIAAAILLPSQGQLAHFSAKHFIEHKGSAFTLFFAAMGGAFWSYDGWGNVAYVGGEIINSKKNLPRAILLGIGSVILIYLMVNLAYIYVLPLDQIRQAPSDKVASLLMATVMGSNGAHLVALMIMLSTFDTVNAGILTNARVYYAMATEGLFWNKVARVHPKYHTPHWSLWLQGLWSVILLVTGSFDLITSMYVFVNWLFYFLMPVALFILRFRERGVVQVAQTQSFRVPFYPVVPLAFAAFTFVYLLQTLRFDVASFAAGTQPTINSLMGVVLVLLGTPFLFLLRKSK